MTREAFEEWLRAYGEAWESKDTAAFLAGFTEDVAYHWTPFDAPKRGHAMLAEAFEAAVARQTGIRFEATVLSVSGDFAICHWGCGLVRVGTGEPVRLDGIFACTFNRDGRCRVFREWWHSSERT